MTHTRTDDWQPRKVTLEELAQVISEQATRTYVVEHAGKSPVTGEDRWTVVEYVNGEATGGDHHWVRERYAERAAEMYRQDPTLHGKPASHLRMLGLRFDPDE